MSFMRTLLIAGAAGLIATFADAATVSLEVATERGLQATAPQEWLQRLVNAGVTNVRLRSAGAGDRPTIETIDGARGASYRVVGVLTSRGELRLPGASFKQRDVAKLRDYLDRIAADGPKSVTEPTGNYGLTKKQFEQVFEDLTQPTIVATAEIPASRLLERLAPRLSAPVKIDAAAQAPLRAGGPIGAELKTLTLGSALGIALRREGLALVPTKPRGEAVQLRVTPAADGLESWPIGYRVEGPPRKAAPGLMQSIEVAIDGYTLAEAVDAIRPRLELPVLWDEAVLAERKIDPKKVDVRLERRRMSYKRIFERLLFQARLRGELRTDEAGTPFYWMTK